MRAGMIALAAGLLSLRLLPVLPSLWLVVVLALLAFSLLLIRAGRIVGLFLLGLCWACWSAQQALDDRLAADLDGRTLWLEGVVAELPERNELGVRFQLEDARSRRGALPQRMRLFWMGGPEVMPGERWRLAVTLRMPRGMVNPQAFDYEAWLMARRIGATGSVKAGERLAPANERLSLWRDQLRRRMLEVDAFGRGGGVVALVLGDGSGLSTQDWRTLQHTGTVHLMVISGQHIVLLAGSLYAFIALLARFGAWPKRWPWLSVACFSAMAGALIYALIAGFEVPAQRACVMVALGLLWRMRFRRLGSIWPWSLALILVLLAEPLAVLQPGFWLSFLAVAVLILAFSSRLGEWRWWQTLLRAQWVMAIGLLPAMMVLGLPIAVSGALANLVAVPWISLLVVPCALLGALLMNIPLLGDALLQLAGGLLAVLFVFLEWLARGIPAWLPSDISWFSFLLVTLGAGLLVLPAGVPGRMLGVLLLLPALWPRDVDIAYGRAEVWMLDVGQGASLLVRTRQHALLYDAAAAHDDFDLGDRVVLPSLRALDVRRLDLLLLSHADNDHAGGAPAVTAGLPVRRTVSGEPQRLPEPLQAEPCQSGESWQWDGVSFRLWQWQEATDSNQHSCVLLIEAEGERMLLSGDLDRAGEQALLDEFDVPSLNWLLAGHHGSQTSSGWLFLKRTRPQHVLISRGWNNAFGHPHPSVMQRFAAVSADVHDTALHGAVRVLLGEYGEPVAWRAFPRFWRQSVPADREEF